jgi:tetraacyldisaccharide-1-P 4'-kinase
LFAVLYGLVTSIRNFYTLETQGYFFFDVPVIAVGEVGGTGKSPK